MSTSVQIVGASEVMREVEQEALSAARSDAKVLITGESGVGKEIVAQLIHNRGPRARSPLVTINCAGVPDSLLESELFGHVRGSFTDAHRDKLGWFEQANGGTIFMDEVGEMSLRMQALLLRFLENGEIQRVGADRMSSVVDVRVIAATNRNLFERTKDHSFREDLYYRLNVIHIAIPPLRERREDIAPLIDHFLKAHATLHGASSPPRLSDEAMARLVAYDWPGNVRELRNMVERLVVHQKSDVIRPMDLPRELAARPSAAAPAVASTADVLFERMKPGGESFWTAVYEPFMARDITRDDLRAIVSRGLEQTQGSYKGVVEHFNLAQGDYKRFLSFLRKYGCHMPFQRFRGVKARSANETADDYRVAAG